MVRHHRPLSIKVIHKKNIKNRYIFSKTSGYQNLKKIRLKKLKLDIFENGKMSKKKK
jgi:hypothetical protein